MMFTCRHAPTVIRKHRSLLPLLSKRPAHCFKIKTKVGGGLPVLHGRSCPIQVYFAQINRIPAEKVPDI